MSGEGSSRQLPRTLAEIAHTLESGDDSDARVERVLELAREIIPYRRCALLRSDGEDRLFTVPPLADGQERSRLVGTLEGVLEVLRGADHDGFGRSSQVLPSLTVPVIGLDRVVGVLRVEPEEDVVFDAQHLRLLSVLGAQLGAYLTMVLLRAEEERKAGELNAAHQFQQLMVGVVSHDLRGPLGAVMVAAQSLQKRSGDEAQARTLGRIVESTRRATRIITDLLDMTRVRGGGAIPIRRRSIDLRELVAEAVEEARLGHPERTIALSAPDGPVASACDADRLRQVLGNLIDNALKYGREASPVGVRLTRGGELAEVEVHNEGAPIAEDVIPTLFNPFRQGRPRYRGRGLGLGLYIVNEVVRAHGGSVEVRSSEEHGTTFTVRLPRGASSELAAGG